MKLSQALIDEAIKKYNQLTEAHKKAPVEKFIHKQLLNGETVELRSGTIRWSSAIQFAGTPECVELRFLINPALPSIFQKQLQQKKEAFENYFTTERS